MFVPLPFSSTAAFGTLDLLFNYGPQPIANWLRQPVKDLGPCQHALAALWYCCTVWSSKTSLTVHTVVSNERLDRLVLTPPLLSTNFIVPHCVYSPLQLNLLVAKPSNQSSNKLTNFPLFCRGKRHKMAMHMYSYIHHEKIPAELKADHLYTW